MAFRTKIFAFILLILVITIVQTQSKPLDSGTTDVNGADEIMDVAEAQNPFLPRFAMRKLKERREKARAQRRNNQINQGQRRLNPPNRVICPQAQRRYYKK